MAFNHSNLKDGTPPQEYSANLKCFNLDFTTRQIMPDFAHYCVIRDACRARAFCWQEGRWSDDDLIMWRNAREEYRLAVMESGELVGKTCADLMGIKGVVTGFGQRNGKWAWIGKRADDGTDWWSYDPDIVG